MPKRSAGAPSNNITPLKNAVPDIYGFQGGPWDGKTEGIAGKFSSLELAEGDFQQKENSEQASKRPDRSESTPWPW